MLLHGTPGCHDGLSGVADDWLKEGFGVLAPSRPGYGRTPLVNSYAEQAHVLAALLDALQIDKVVPLCVSGGGPAGIQFAALHPDRTYALLTECAVTGLMGSHPIE